MPPKEEYAKIVCMFLAELLRTRKISLSRAAEIAQTVTNNINLVDSEEHFLSLVKQLASDFEELFHLQAMVDMHMQVSRREDMDEKVRTFVISSLIQDSTMALTVLQEAVKENVSTADLCRMFPKFNEFLLAQAKQPVAGVNQSKLNNQYGPI